VTYAVEFHAPAAKELAKLDTQLRLRITGVIELLSVDPRPPGAVMLRGGEHGRWRVRVGDYRVVYAVDDGQLVVLVLRIAHRREVYDR
jgi:mRNA interferase RelE/StbE